MKIRYAQPHAALALGAMVLLGGAFAAVPARAQDAGAASDKPITLSFNNVPIRMALQILFKSAGIRNFTIANDVYGNATLQTADAPFSTALSQLLKSVNATFTVNNGSYDVAVNRPAPPPTATISPQPNGTTVVGSSDTANTDAQPKRFYPIPINHYDAVLLAAILGQQGLVRVDVNGILPSAFGGQGVGQGGQGGPASGITSVGGGVGGGGFGGGRGGGFGGGGGGFGGGGGGFGGGRGGGGFGGGFGG